MKTFVLLAVGLALLFAVSAQDVTRNTYVGNDCTGALEVPQPGRSNPFITKVGDCIPETSSDPSRPGRGSKVSSCDGKAITIKFYLNDDSKLTSSCLRVDPNSNDLVLSLNECYASGSSGSFKVSATCNTPTVKSGSGSPINIGFLAFSLFLSSVVAALIL
jgi:hypothetical protein